MKRVAVYCFTALLLLVNIFPEEPVNVSVKKIKVSEVYDTLYYGSRIQPVTTITAYATVSGIITKINVKEGDPVKQGEPLLYIARKSSYSDYLPTTIKSSITGVVAEVKVSEKMDIFEKGELLVVADISSFKTEILLSDKDLPKVKTGDLCFVKNTKIEGVVTAINLIPESNTGLFRTTINFKESKELFTGKFIELELRVDNYKGVLVPIEWVVNKYGKSLIYIHKSGKVDFREVTTGKRYGKKIAIIKGVAAGEEAIVKYNKQLFNHTPVNITEQIEDKQNKNQNSKDK